MSTALLGDLVQIKGGGTPDKSVSAYWGGDIPWASVKDFKSTEIDTTIDSITQLGVLSSATNIVTAGSILVPTRMAVGKAAINKIDVAINQDIKALLIGPRVETRYLLHVLLSKAELLETQATGATVKGITLDVLKRLEIPLPPLDEQRRIAAILDQADDLRRKRRDAIGRIGALKTSLLSEFIASTNRPKRVRLADVAAKITDGTHQAPTWTKSGVPFIFVSNVRNGKISLETDKFVSQETYNVLTKNAPIERGDILYTAVGSYGHSAVVETDEKFLFQRHVAHIKPNRVTIRSEFLAPLLESPIVRRQADRIAKGVAQKTVTLSDLKSFEIELPSLDEQDIFVVHARKIDDIGRANYQHLAHLDTLFASLQHRAFRGEL